MALDEDEKATLKIRCPSCSQRFNVNADLRDRMVECGGCEHRFRITEDVIVRTKRVYPGEKRKPFDTKYQRVPMAVSPSLDDRRARPLHPVQTPALTPAAYGKEPDPAVIGPVSPQRVIAGIVGVVGMAVMALLLIFGSARGGMLDGIAVGGRLMMAAFAALLGVAFLAYANPKARTKALLVGGLMGAGLLSLPFFFKQGSERLEGAEVEVEVTPLIPPADAEEEVLKRLKEQIGVSPLAREQERLEKSGSGKRAYGIWLRQITESLKVPLRDYFLRATDADPASHPYPRDGDSYLLVLTGLEQPIDSIAEIAAAIGSVEKIYEELGVIEVLVDSRAFAEGSLEKLSDKNDPAFYDLNKWELQSIQKDRVARAVQRLAEAEPKIYRTDITRRLLDLLADPDVDFHGSICKALRVWSEDPGPTGRAAVTAMEKLFHAGKPVPREMVELLAHLKQEAAIPVVDQLWFAEPVNWESLYGDFGSAIEDKILLRFDQSKGATRTSAVRLLGRVGSAKSLPALEAAKKTADAELSILIDNSVKAIRLRASS